MCRRWKDVCHAEGVSQGVREDVIRVYRDSGASVAQVAKDFGISPSCLKRWLTIDEPMRCVRRTGGSSCLSRGRNPRHGDVPGPGHRSSALLRWLANPVTDAELTTAYRANALFDGHCDDPEFGYRFLVDEARDAGEPMADRTAWRICSDRGWWSVFGKKRGKNGKKPGLPVHDDVTQGRDSQRGLHTRLYGGAGVLDRAEVELALAGRVLGDVGQSLLIRPGGGELAVDQIVMDRRAGLTGQAAFLGER